MLIAMERGLIELLNVYMDNALKTASKYLKVDVSQLRPLVQLPLHCNPISNAIRY